MHIIGADIGGTNSRFGHFHISSRGDLRLAEKPCWIQTNSVSSFDDLLDKLSHSDFGLPLRDADAVAVAIAGPVKDGRRCAPVNIRWSIDLEDTCKSFPLQRSLLINDFVAQAHACGTPAVRDTVKILAGEPAPGGAIAVIGAGTGLGKCCLAAIPGGGAIAVPSEGGHSEFPFVNKDEEDFAHYLRHVTGRTQLIGDIVVTGLGLRLLHRHLSGKDESPEAITALFDLPDGHQHPTLRWFSKFYGRACRNYALEVLATGGVCISGGLAARSQHLVRHKNFAEEFRHSETHAPLLARIPVSLNTNQDFGLWGAAAVAAQRLLGITPRQDP